MSTMRDDLSAAAILGTARRPWSPAGEGSPVGALAARAAAGRSPEAALLAAAGAFAVHDAAGLVPAMVETSLPEAPDDAAPEASPRVASIVLRIAQENADVLPEALGLLAKAGLRIPPRYLAAFLSIGPRTLGDADIDAVVGARGRWAASLNDAWAYAVPTDPAADLADPEALERVWELAGLDDRTTWLSRLRRTHPEEAQGLVAAAWDSLKAAEKAALLRTLTTCLSAGDVPLLEQARADASTVVATLAVNMLTEIPESPVCAEAWDVVRPTIRVHKAILGRRSLEIELPDEIPDDLMAVGGQPQAQFGGAAWRFAGLLAAVPPARWTAFLETPVEQIVAMAEQTDWADPLILGWLRAADRFGPVEWVNALVGPLSRRPVVIAAVRSIWKSRKHYPDDDAVAAILPRGSELYGQAGVLQVLGLQRRPWSLNLTRAVLACARRCYDAKLKPDYTITGDVFPTLALGMDPRVAPEAGEWMAGREWRRTIERLELRHELWKELGHDDNPQAAR